MIGRTEGIDQRQNAHSLREISREQETERTKSIRDKVESLREDQLSPEELKEDLKEKIDDMNDIMETLDEKLSFELHDKTETIMTQIIDIKTKEVIKEMPPEEMLDLSARIHEMVGLIIDEEV